MLLTDMDHGAPPVTFADAMLDPSGRLKMARGQNVYDVDFEYGQQPLRWENFTSGTASILHMPMEGGVRMRVAAANDIAIRQSKPYFRYQPSKGIYASAAVLFGAPAAGVIRRVGMFDSDNGVFFEQDATGLFAVRRANTGAGVVDTRVAQRDWNINPLNGAGPAGRTLDPSAIQMAVMDYAWYGAGRCRLGFVIGGKLIWCHQFQQANVAGAVLPWSRTGNLPCRYEIRRSNAGTADFWHWGVSVVVEGGFDEQRGFTFPHALDTRVAVTARRPILSSRVRPLGAINSSGTATGGGTNSLSNSGAGWTTNQWRGQYVFTTGGTGAGQIARITGNSSTTLTVDNPLTLSASPFSPAPAAGTTYQIGLVNRGNLNPRQLVISADAAAYVELILNGTLTGATWAGLAANGSPSSLSERDVSATAISAGERILGTYAMAGTTVIDLRDVQPLGTNILGTTPDVLSVVATSFSGTANIAASMNYQEAMS
ncbi:hypothetical protein KTR66_09875 [Roseococcus sp. SDR]|uniref:hypothetical protein n=1 Tax=Roseococcus sp. SDR TaxID=2835532 RepID=UPI001BD152CE|nr:hypothetical protein [Roseococcus sp. SDR]MBS7790305.1 hypothetical protein [Roseococcus sp. SDR]MBV1845619.1 hypothetical protein [Roseococcus sp. SDR]